MYFHKTMLFSASDDECTHNSSTVRWASNAPKIIAVLAGYVGTAEMGAKISSLWNYVK